MGIQMWHRFEPIPVYYRTYSVAWFEWGGNQLDIYSRFFTGLFRILRISTVRFP